ncbi:MAG: hypothetical protein KAW09_11870 [Thermoplasmata archaeon]|nr:hypothetical protein [Thermoplasmata archaeon]
MREYRISNDIYAGICEHCNKKSRYGKHDLHVVKVTNIGTGEDEWRCSNCVRHLNSDVAHRLASMDLQSVF